jgi:hypothetical protein
MRYAKLAAVLVITLAALCGCPPKYTVQRDVTRPPNMPEGVIPEITGITGLAKTIPSASASALYDQLKEALTAAKIAVPSPKKKHLKLKITVDCILKGKVTRGPLKLDSYMTTVKVRLERFESDNAAKSIAPAQIIVDRFLADPLQTRPESIKPENIKIEKSFIVITCEEADYKTETAMVRSVDNAVKVMVPLATAFARANVPVARTPKQPKIKAP